MATNRRKPQFHMMFYIRPLFFVLYISDMHLHCAINSNWIRYADDNTVFTQGDCITELTDTLYTLSFIQTFPVGCLRTIHALLLKNLTSHRLSTSVLSRHKSWWWTTLICHSLMLQNFLKLPSTTKYFFAKHISSLCLKVSHNVGSLKKRK